MFAAAGCEDALECSRVSLSSSQFLTVNLTVYLFDVKNRILKTGNYSVRNNQLGVHFSFDRDGRVEDGEIDLLIAGHGTSYLVECKAGARADKLGRDSIRKVATWRDRLAGTHGGAVFLCLNEPPREIVSPMNREAEQLDVTFWFGRDGIDAYLKWLRGLAFT